MTDFQKIFEHLDYTLELIDTSLIDIPVESYQREQQNPKVQKIVREWDDNIANEPKVSFRDGKYRVFDGQHTIAARIARNDYQDLQIVCKVYEGLTLEKEALLFAEQTGCSTKPKSGQLLHARLIGKDSVSQQFLKATEEAGVNLSLSNARGYDRIACINSAKKIFLKVGKEKYIETLKLIRDIWFGVPKSFCVDVLTGISAFVNVYHGVYQRDSLIKKMAKITPEQFCRKVLIDESIKGNYKAGKMVLKIYNAGRKQPLKSRF